MENVIPLKSFTDLLSQLEGEKIPFHRIKDKSTVMVPTPRPHQEGAFYIRWEPAPGVVQFIYVLPLIVPEDNRNEMGALLNRINFELPILGFALNESNGALTYRTQAFLDKDRSIPPGMIGAVIALAAHTVDVFLPRFKAAMPSPTKEFPESPLDPN